MKEVIAIIRMNMINKTKEALLREGFPALSANKVLGRGKKKVDFSFIENMLSGDEMSTVNEFTSPVIAEALTEGQRLIPKRMLSIVARDDEIKTIVDVIISVNQQGKPGDGKIFVMPVLDCVRVRTGETGELAL
ncbi:MAG TPA: P-II family nitrogen regulator [Syntrophomonadaceae bacterium]|nr:P-II family nitrogen regulator [Syntrophomonadaceae bacterium]